MRPLGRLVASYRWIGWSAFFGGSVIAGPLADGLDFGGAFTAFAAPNVALLAVFPFAIRRARFDEPLAT
jgi:hypothetical protein